MWNFGSCFGMGKAGYYFFSNNSVGTTSMVCGKGSNLSFPVILERVWRDNGVHLLPLLSNIHNRKSYLRAILLFILKHRIMLSNRCMHMCTWCVTLASLEVMAKEYQVLQAKRWIYFTSLPSGLWESLSLENSMGSYILVGHHIQTYKQSHVLELPGSEINRTICCHKRCACSPGLSLQMSLVSQMSIKGPSAN